MGNNPQCDICGNERAISTAERLTKVEAALTAIEKKLDEAILTQLKDHGKRIAVLERLEQRRIGGRAAIAAIMTACASTGGIIAAAIIKMWG